MDTFGHEKAQAENAKTEFGGSTFLESSGHDAGSSSSSSSTSMTETNSSQNTDATTPTLSKRQLKKMKKMEKVKEFRRENRKVVKERRKRKRAEGTAVDSDRGPSRKLLKSCTMAVSKCRQRVAVDVSFDHLMSDKDIMKTLTQLQYCYSANRRSENPLQFYIVGFTGKTRERYDSISGCKNWDVFVKNEPYEEVFPKSDCVYLTSESPNEMTDLDENKVYIIGGFVDHNHHKGFCYKLAQEKGVAHARLPIDKYIHMETRKVLTINHVFEILLRYTACKQWEKAFFDVIPKRKGLASVADNENDGGNDSDHVTQNCNDKNQSIDDNSEIKNENIEKTDHVTGERVAKNDSS